MMKRLKLGMKSIVLLFTILACIIIAFYVALVMHIAVVYTHLFYLPILLAGVWYQRKAVYVALGLGIVHILVTSLSSLPLTMEEFGRAAIFIVVAYVIGFVSEERVKGEKALRESEEKFRAIFEGAIDGIIAIHLKTKKYVFANPGMSKLTGYSSKELLELAIAKLHHKKDLPYVLEQFAKVAQGEITLAEDIPILRKDDTVVYCDVNTQRLKLEGEEYLVGFFRDITERIRAEEERTRLIRALERKTKELEQIVYATSHDLRSPLVNVQGFSKELEQSLKELSSALQGGDVPEAVIKEITPILKEDVPEALRYIHTGTSKMDSLLSGLLRLSRLGRAALDIEKLDMNKLMSDIEGALDFQIKEKSAELIIDSLPPCRGDYMQINQVFSNLLDNAIKYLEPNRPGVIKVSGCLNADQSIYCVEDNGIGIAAEHQAKIFEIFQQLDPGTTTGEGLGLTIVRQILDRHKGSIWVESEQGKGSRFFVALPAWFQTPLG